MISNLNLKESLLHVRNRKQPTRPRGAVCPGQHPAPWTRTGAEGGGGGPHPQGPRTPEGGLQGGHKPRAGGGGPSSLTLSSHEGAGGCRDTHKGPDLRSNSLAETQRKKNPPKPLQIQSKGQPQVHSHSPRSTGGEACGRGGPNTPAGTPGTTAWSPPPQGATSARPGRQPGWGHTPGPGVTASE